MLRVYKICIENNITLSELADYIGLFYTQISAMFRMKIDLPLKHLIKIRDYLIFKDLFNINDDIGMLLDII